MANSKILKQKGEFHANPVNFGQTKPTEKHTKQANFKVKRLIKRVNFQ